MSRPEFREWPKISRFFRDIVISEKIDGTNACIIVEAGHPSDDQSGWCGCATALNGRFLKVGAQSRSRVITPEDDNHGFARWVRANAEFLGQYFGASYNWDDGGPAYHYGEWWGLGIQRNYGQSFKRFSLFNTSRWAHLACMVDMSAKRGPITVGSGDPATTALLGVVPVLYEGPMDTDAVRDALHELRDMGSAAAPGFTNPEGICIYHTASGVIQKVTLDKNDAEKFRA